MITFGDFAAIVSIIVSVFQLLPAVWRGYNQWLASKLKRIQLALSILAERSILSFAAERFVRTYVRYFQNFVPFSFRYFLIHVLVSILIFFMAGLNYRDFGILLLYVLVLSNGLFVNYSLWFSFSMVTSILFLEIRTIRLFQVVMTNFLLSLCLAFVLISCLTVPLDKNYLIKTIIPMTTVFLISQSISLKKRMSQLRTNSNLIVPDEKEFEKLPQDVLANVFNFSLFLMFWICSLAAILILATKDKISIIEILDYPNNLFTNWIVFSSFSPLLFWTILSISLLIAKLLNNPILRIITFNLQFTRWLKKHLPVTWLLLISSITIFLFQIWKKCLNPN